MTSLSSILDCLPYWRYTTSPEDTSLQDTVIMQGKTINVIVPKSPLAMGSVQIIKKLDVEQPNQQEMYEIHQKILRVFEEQGIDSYLRYRVSTTPGRYWEIIPFSKNSSSVWQQLKLLWRVIFGGKHISQDQRELFATNFRKTALNIQEAKFSTHADSRNLDSKSDAFCNKDIIDKQWVFKGELITILYDYAPIGIGKNKLHFLFVPNRHCEKFSELIQEEHREVSNLSEKLIRFYKDKEVNKKSFSAYMFDKTGSQAGQTVTHWHQHIVFTTTKIQGIWGKLTILKKMLFGSSPLSDEDLKQKVVLFRKELKDLSNI